ncbi:hypothetical protein GWR56_13690 [Mucilaginibacter sp. 14171R-50]|uniref:DUF6035 family protein n=1 Tax=Mucilaginibacter sp. 14171R-50 TaxID=2703789 RepID=UPI00138C9F77|nr:DUF6035 family protein [Mucilaginibacter sp. 14171R-50]QHS56541.1 hypothetical protein GWR56_13690 [Mucilaginibacter sp. 14171R-50]
MNLTTGEQIEVDELFKDQHTNEAKIFQLRTQIEKNLQNNAVELVCLYCKQPVAIRGRVSTDQKKTFYFTHPYKSADCVIKTQSRLTEEEVRCIKYNGEKESILHDTLKRLIAHFLTLNPGINSVKVDEVYKDQAISNKWRKPDVLADHNKIGKIAFELQLSTTFLSVIVGRSLFYQQQGVYLIWVFPNFSLQSDLQKFTQKDVFYNNNNNVYVFDQKAQAKSRESGKLILTCYYREFFIDDLEIKARWNEASIGLDEIRFISHEKFYYYDSEGGQKVIEEELTQLKVDRKKADARAQTQRTQDKIAEYLNRFYKKDWLHENEREHLSDLIKYSISAEDLEERLKFCGDNAQIITKLFFERRKFNFLRFLCSTDKILVNTALLIHNGVNVFQEILRIPDEMFFQQYLTCLFRKGYVMTEHDQQDLQQLYDKNYFNQSEYEKQQIERWATVKVYAGLANQYAAFELTRLNKILMAVSSLKYKMIIGFRYIHMKQVAHYIFDSQKDYAMLYFRAIKVYGYYDQLLLEDKSGKLKGRFNYYERTGTIPYPENGSLLMNLFPELKPLHNI